MSRVFFIADTHFNHQHVAELRGFESVTEHDCEVINRWNSVVQEGDVVWHLGDVGMTKPFLPLLDLLNGRKHLITGNHDAPWPGHHDSWKHQLEWLWWFDSVQPFARRRFQDEQIMLSHFPYYGDHTETDRFPEYRLRDHGKWLLCGHVHGAWKVHVPQINVGLDVWDLTPVSLEQIQEIMQGS